MSRARDRGTTARGTMSVRQRRRLEKGVVFAATRRASASRKACAGRMDIEIQSIWRSGKYHNDKPVMKKTESVVWPES